LIEGRIRIGRTLLINRQFECAFPYADLSVAVGSEQEWQQK